MFTLHRKSCEGMTEIANESVDIIVTSPPYKEDDGYSTKLMKDFALHSYRVLKPGSLCFINFGQLAKHKERPFEVAEIFARQFEWIDTIIWVKSNQWTGGHYTPVNSKYRMNSMYEFIFQFSKGIVEIDRLALGVPYMDKGNIYRYGSRNADTGSKQDLRCAGNVWYVSHPTVKGKDTKLHKDMFPDEIPRRCFKLTNLDPNATVLDPFMGSGTTGKVACEMGYKAIGYEVNDKFWNREKDLFEE